MNFGDLWQYPFLATVWGTVAAWAGWVGTVVSLGTAAYYYRSTVKRDERAQAQQIRFVQVGQNDSKGFARVHNDSDHAIYDIQVKQARRRFQEVVDRACEFNPVSTETLARLYEDWKRASGGYLQIHSFQQTHIQSGRYFKVTYRLPYSDTEKVWITFRDANGKLWNLELDTHNPTEVKDSKQKPYTLRGLIKYPEARAVWRRYREVDAWVKKNCRD